jgi:hypothetical protein
VKFARIQGDIVAEVIELPDDVTPDLAFHPDIAATLVQCSDKVAPGWRYAGGKFSAPQAEDAESLEQAKTRLSIEVDAGAEAARLLFVTPGAGQAAVYRAKADEARTFLTTSDPSPEGFPLLAASVGVEGDTLASVAGLVNAREADWLKIAATIERERLGAKRAIRTATTIEQATAARDAVTWPTPDA